MKSGGRSNRTAWLLLLACGVLIIGAMACLTHGVLESERERSLAMARADLEERIRLSLWRMDGAASAVTIEENQRVMNPAGNQLPNSFARVRFQLSPDCRAIPTEPCSDEQLAELNQLLQADEDLIPRYQLMCQAVHSGAQQWSANAYIAGNTKDPEGERTSLQYQQELSMKERAVRGKTVNAAVEKAGLAQQLAAPGPDQPLAAFATAFQPAWIGQEAFLLREVQGDEPMKKIEGVWLKTAEFKELLLGEIRDLLPRADLEPMKPMEAAGNALALASFPWRLVPGESAAATTEIRGAVTPLLAAGWVVMLVALAAGAFMVHGIMKLSERRASFVSAVTHELRTPLTTFRLYSDMLESGAVTEEKKRTTYFRTLRREADRLSHLVENVLAFSQIERRPTKPKAETLEVGGLVDSMRERFEERLAGARMTLVVDVPAGLEAAGSATAIEHVLFNLIDNAAKYAAGGDPPEVRLAAKPAGEAVEILVCDHGPGIDEAEFKEVFRAFHKSAQAAAESRPGVGLGLALSRRLARSMNGDLLCRSSAEGACFVLRLPAS
ncbi:sensor histidine kinase [Haloferula rosea]|uniref:histidine kinase n=1 Tax=Haloferula rosea TaxID=490093 RepID=A0A934RCQ5_9BACT|nr:HAMP domain-containing sensor histidine kinase [Haloferula rosea]MBK1826631.1 HAMP domain-containing histidine kinase [Haloferula rosea]